MCAELKVVHAAYAKRMGVKMKQFLTTDTFYQRIFVYETLRT